VKAAELYNYAEVVIWPIIGALCAGLGWTQHGRARRRYFIASIVLVIFGASDWFEANTENEWWHPWWLLLWKASCVIALACVLIDAWRHREAINPAAPLRGCSNPQH
jgi:hypothetical protein